MAKPIAPLYHKAALLLVKRTLKPRWGKLAKKGTQINGVKTFIKKEEKVFTFSFIPTASPKRLETGEDFKKVEFQSRGEKLMLESLFINSYSPPQNTGQTSFFHSKGFSKKRKYYYRLIMPLDHEIRFHNILQQKWYKTDLGYSSSSCSMCSINGDTINLYILHDDKKKYFLSIESDKIQSFEVFSAKAFASINALGYLTGKLAGDFGWFITYNKKDKRTPTHFYFCGLRDAIRSSYTPVDSNPYSRLSHKRKIADKLYKSKTLRSISIVEFSQLCQKLHDSREFTSVLILMLESSVASLLFMPGGYAIALESISDLILGKSKLKLAPIKSKATSRLIISECKEIIAKNSATIDPTDVDVLNKRIEQLNQITNKARLQAPFKKLGIKLLDEDLKVLASRNDFLHGRYPDFTKGGMGRSNDRINRDLVYASYRFYTLLNMLILKWVGYNNKIINYPKISENYCKIKLKEDYYRQV